MHNIYRVENGEWNTYTKVVFNDGQVMDEYNHDFERDGFFWSDEPPVEYTEWLNKKEDWSYE